MAPRLMLAEGISHLRAGHERVLKDAPDCAL